MCRSYDDEIVSRDNQTSCCTPAKMSDAWEFVTMIPSPDFSSQNVVYFVIAKFWSGSKHDGFFAVMSGPPAVA